MNKKLLALAVTSALAGVSAGVNADTANVNVYGKVYVQAQSVSGKGATVPGAEIVSHQEITDPNSYIGFKGEDSLGGGMKGWFQIESRIRGDIGTGTFAGRNTGVGLSGGFGNVFLGKWDTVYKQLGDPVSFLGISAGNFVSTSNVLSRRFDGAAAADFHLRPNNYIEYDTPNMGGVTVMAGYSPDEVKTGTKNAYLQTVGVKFEKGPLYVAFANELHNDFFGTATVDSKDTATRVSAKYALPTGTTFGIDVANLEYKLTSAGGSVTGKNQALSLVATQALGSITVAGGVVKAMKFSVDGTDVPDSEAQQLNLGVSYSFSKRTSAYAIYSKLTNKDFAAFNNTNLGTVGFGVDPEQIAVGLATTF